MTFRLIIGPPAQWFFSARPDGSSPGERLSTRLCRRRRGAIGYQVCHQVQDFFALQHVDGARGHVRERQAAAQTTCSFVTRMASLIGACTAACPV